MAGFVSVWSSGSLPVIGGVSVGVCVSAGSGLALRARL